MSRLTDRLERDLREIAAGAHPSPSAWESIAARLGDDAEPEVARVLAPSPDRSRSRVKVPVPTRISGDPEASVRTRASLPKPSTYTAHVPVASTSTGLNWSTCTVNSATPLPSRPTR